MILFLKFLLAHILGDFVLQPSNWVIDKEKKKIKSVKLYFHILIHAFLLLLILDFNLKKYGLGFIIIIFSHFIFDVIKLYIQDKKTKKTWFFIDQILHLAVLIYVYSLYKTFSFSLHSVLNKKTLLLIIAIVMITHVASVIIKMIITQWNPETKKENDDSLAKAGRYIGFLERLFIFTFVITNHWQAIGFLLAAKSVFRFGDLTSSKDRKLTEYILIGTLLSFGFAILIGILYTHFITLI